jgi:glycine cleavage system H protein
MNQPKNLKYTKTHEWVRWDGAQIVVGITDFAQHQLSDVVHVELPEVGDKYAAGAEAVVVESIKAASDVYAPVAGVISDVNTSLINAPEAINADPCGQGWLFKMTPDRPEDVDGLMTGDQYEVALPEER